MEKSIIHGAKLTEFLREKVQKAFIQQNITTLEIAEFYIVNLLQEFHNAEGMYAHMGHHAVEKPLAIMLLEAMSKDQHKKLTCLRHVGDSALVIVGFFEDRVRRGIMDSSYYVSIGESAYGTLAHIHEPDGTFFDLYSELAEKFGKFAEAIAGIAPWNTASSDTDLVRIYERWILSGDNTLKELLDKEGIKTEENREKG